MPDRAKERVNGIALGEWLKRQRNLRNMTQAQVAEASGKPQGQIAKLENGQRATVPREDLEAYARGVRSSESAALRAVNHTRQSTRGLSSLPEIEDDEDAVAIAEAYTAYTSSEAREIIRRALQYADAVEQGLVTIRTSPSHVTP